MSVSEEVCRRCGHGFCSECVVFPFGVSKGAMCISCALEAGGVSRQKTGRPRLTHKEVKERLEQFATSVQSEAQTVPEAPVERADEDIDRAWLHGEVDPESIGGWSRTF